MKAELVAVVVKEFRQILRDPRMSVMLVIPPILQLIIFGYAINYDVKDVRTSMCDLDRTSQSRDFLQGLVADGTFVVAPAPRDCLHPEEVVREGVADVAVLVPSGFARSLARAEKASVQFMVDGTNPVVGRFARDTLAFYAAQAGVPYALRRLEAASGQAGRVLSAPGITVEPRLLFNPEMRTSLFMVPGVAGMLLIVVTMVATAMGLAREKETGVLEQIVVTPIPVPILIVGKVLPFVLVGLLDVVLVLIVSIWLFEVPVRGSLFLYGLGTLLYLFTTVGLGIFISTISNNQQQAFLSGFLLLAPLVVLSGVMTPIASMPDWLQAFTYLNPMRYYVEILRGVLLKSSDIYDLSLGFVSLTIFGVLIMVLASMRFRKRLG